MMSPPRPTPRDYALLGLPPGAPLARCVAAHAYLDWLYDPRKWPDAQHWALDRQNALDEALAWIIDCAAEVDTAVAA